jgi:paraquat-inducible protein B
MITPSNGNHQESRHMSSDSPARQQPRVSSRRNWLPSLIWLIPIVAALVGVTLVARILMERGPEIVLTFKTAEGLEAGKTAVKYKDVQIGIVDSLRLTRDRTHVRVTVKLNKDAEAFTARDTRYWVVRPRLGTAGISGLGTLLSGAYIVADPGQDEERADAFLGLEVPPIVTRDASGRQYQLRATSIGSLDVGSPVYYRRIKVGQVAAYELDADGGGVTLNVFVNTPYEKFVGTNTRFWHASGLDVAINASGLTLRTQSLASIMLGGIAFGAPEEQRGADAPANAAFALAADEALAMMEPDGPAQTLVLFFDQSLRGLAPGAPVDFRGVVIGEVRSIGIEFDRKARVFRMPVQVQVYPGRLSRRSVAKLQEDEFAQQRSIEFMIGRGLRAQLRNGNLLTGQIYVALDFFPKVAPAKVDFKKVPLEMPTVASSLEELQTQVQSIATRMNKIPFEQIGADLLTALASLNKTLASTEQLASTLNNDVSPEITATMQDARKTISSAQQTLQQDAPLQQDLRQTLQEVTRAAASMRQLTDYLERNPESLLRGKPEDKR